jgi:glycosyltransferase involved in cell wall biosynthesis
MTRTPTPEPAGPTPRVSVVVCVRDPDPDQFTAALASLQAQDLRAVDPHALEVVVVETEGERPAAPVLGRFDELRIVHRIAPRGLGRARNLGIATARAPYVAILDGDDMAAPDRLAQQAAFLDAHPEVAVVGSAIRYVDLAGEPVGSREYPLEHDAIARAMRRFNALAHPTVMFRRDVVRAAGGYLEDSLQACDDYELWSRLARSGHRLANLASALVDYRLHETSMKSRLVRATLRDTIAVKRRYWVSEFDWSDRARMTAERVLLCLPPTLVRACFDLLVVRRRSRA